MLSNSEGILLYSLSVKAGRGSTIIAVIVVAAGRDVKAAGRGLGVRHSGRRGRSRAGRRVLSLNHDLADRLLLEACGLWDDVDKVHAGSEPAHVIRAGMQGHDLAAGCAQEADWSTVAGKQDVSRQAWSS